jgi:hypothetical protein
MIGAIIACAPEGLRASEPTIPPAYPSAGNTGAFGPSNDYTVTVEGVSAPVYATTIKQLRWGGSGSIPTTTASFVPFDFSGAVTVTITAQVTINRLTIRPLSAGITPMISGKQATFTLNKAQYLLVEVNDSLAPSVTTIPNGTVAPPLPLFIFASSPQTTPAATTTFTPASFSALSSWPTAAGTYVFSPGLYTTGALRLHSGQRIHLSPGALLQTTIDSTDATNVSITGTGIIDGSRTAHKADLLMDFNRCRNVTLDGPLLHNSPHWTVTLWNCQDVAISRIKVLNTHRPEGANGDGTDICNSQRVTISDSFYYTTDDCISPKGATWFPGHAQANLQNLEDLIVSNCTLMTSTGYGVRIGDESRAPLMRNLTVRDCDIYGAGSAVGIQVVDSAIVSNVTFEDLRIERYFGYPLSIAIFKNEYTTDAAFGKVRDVLFKDISILTQFGAGASKIYGNDPTASVDGVTFENFRLRGTEIKTFAGGQLYGKTVTSMVTPSDDFIYNLIYRTGRPTITANASDGGAVQTVTFNSLSTGSSIYYTTDGSVPSSTNGTLYSGTAATINVGANPVRLRAIAVANGLSPSVITEITFSAVTATTATTPPTLPSAILSNLSVRTTLPADQILVVGLTVQGTKPVLLRAAGPALAALGVPGAMPDPKLVLYNGQAAAAADDDWTGATILAAQAALGAFPFAVGSRDAALLAPISGGRTLHVSGPAAGNVLFEAYDAGTGTEARLVNLSARNLVGTGANVLIVGFTVGGSGQKNVLLRAAGPALGALGVAGALADPKLELFDSAQRKIAENDDATPAARAAFAAVGAFPFAPDSKDAAFLVSLNPGGYTLVVSGVANSTGQALAEVYEAPLLGIP